MKLSEIKQLLAAHGVQLTKSLGQNFLHDANQLQRIVAAAQLVRKDQVLEIGPGLGPLTERLAGQVDEILAIEKDLRLIEIVRSPRIPLSRPVPFQWALVSGATDKTDSTDNAAAAEASSAEPIVRLIHDDALEFLRRERRDWTGWKLVSNLPYSVASPILVELAQLERGPQRMVATLQIEVARRIQATAGDPDYGVLSLLVQVNYEPTDCFRIPARCFFPEPDVDSACICLVRRDLPLLPHSSQGTFTRVVKRSFSQRRKMMIKLLKEDWPAARLERAFEELALSPQTRAEQVDLKNFAQLTQRLEGIES